MKFVIVRGPDGSGKSEFVKRLGGKSRTNYWHTGLYWYELGRGHYFFNKDKIEESILWCLGQVRTAMERGLPLVFFGSSEPKVGAYEGYLDLAKEFGYELEIYRTPGPWYPENLFPDNPIPGKILRKQIAEYEPFQEEVETQMLDLPLWFMFTPGSGSRPRPHDETA